MGDDGVPEARPRAGVPVLEVDTVVSSSSMYPIHAAPPPLARCPESGGDVGGDVVAAVEGVAAPVVAAGGVGGGVAGGVLDVAQRGLGVEGEGDEGVPQAVNRNYGQGGR